MRAPAEDEPGRAVELGLGRREERRAEAEGDRAGDDRQPEVEQVGHRRHGPAHQPAGALDHLGTGLGRRAGDP